MQDNGKIVRDIDLSDGSWFPDASIVEKEASEDEEDEEEEEEDKQETEDEIPCIMNLSVFFKPLA
jgi:hypothetical protein